MNEIVSNLSQLCPDKVCFFGGSFNPWHEGHNNCLSLFPEPNELIVLPDHNPLKDSNSTRPVIDAGEIKVFWGFWEAQEKNPTSKWLTALKELRPDIEIGLLMGHDSFANLDEWYEYKTLLNTLNNIYVVAREDDEQDFQRLGQNYTNINQNIRITYLGHHNKEHLSSTKLRNS